MVAHFIMKLSAYILRIKRVSWFIGFRVVGPVKRTFRLYLFTCTRVYTYIYKQTHTHSLTHFLLVFVICSLNLFQCVVSPNK